MFLKESIKNDPREKKPLCVSGIGLIKFDLLFEAPEGQPATQLIKRISMNWKVDSLRLLRLEEEEV